MTLSAPHVVFGAGPLGRATATALLARGHDVVVATRSGTLPSPPAGARLLAADLTDPAAARAACRGAASVYLCAQPPYHRWDLFPPLQDAAIDAAGAAGARLVVAENLYGYGPVTAPMTEDLPLRPTARKGRIRAAMTGTLLHAAAEGRVETAIVRASDFFGPWVEGSAVGGRLFRAILAGRTAETFGDPDAPHSYTFVEDFGTALAIAGTDARAVGQVWHVPNALAVSTRRFVEIAFRLAGRTAKMRRMGRAELTVIGLFVRPIRESIEMLYEFEAPFTVDHQKFAGVFGDIATPLESALARTLDWTRAQG